MGEAGAEAQQEKARRREVHRGRRQRSRERQTTILAIIFGGIGAVGMLIALVFQLYEAIWDEEPPAKPSRRPAPVIYESADDYWRERAEQDRSFDPFNYGLDPTSEIDCEDIMQEVYVGAFDDYGLDADGDGWGCERWRP